MIAKLKARGVACLASVLLASRACPDPVVIEGAPRIGYAVQKHSQHIGSLWCALEALGCPMPYEELLVASGAAFRIAWWPGYYHYAAVDITPEDHILIGAEAAGATAEWRSYATLEEAWDALRESIDAGRPVIAWRGGYGARAILGYDTDGQRIHVRDYNNAADEYDVIDLTIPQAQSPLTRPENEICLISYGPDAPPPMLDWPRIIQRAVMYADWPEENKLCEVLVFGLPAYDAWAKTLRDGVDRFGAENDSALTMYQARMLTDARSSASVVLQESAVLHEALGEAAGHYMREAEIMKGMSTVLSQGLDGRGAETARAWAENFPNQQVREQAAELVELAKAEEIEALNALRAALQEFALE